MASLIISFSLFLWHPLSLNLTHHLFLWETVRKSNWPVCVSSRISATEPQWTAFRIICLFICTPTAVGGCERETLGLLPSPSSGISTLESATSPRLISVLVGETSLLTFVLMWCKEVGKHTHKHTKAAVSMVYSKRLGFDEHHRMHFLLHLYLLAVNTWHCPFVAFEMMNEEPNSL